MSDEPRFNQLLSRLKSNSEQDRQQAIDEIKQHQNQEKMLPHLIKLLDEVDDCNIKVSVIEGISSLGSHRIIKDLMDLANLSNCTHVRIAAIEALGRLKNEATLVFLNKLVNRDDDPNIIKAASVAIQVIQGIAPSWSQSS